MRVKDALGRFGEDLAVRHLQAHGFVVLERNWRCAEGELDVVAQHGQELVVVEVKTRSTAVFGSPAEAVNPAKAARLRLLAGRWLDEQHRAGHAHVRSWSAIRIDVIAIVRSPRGAAPELEHFVGAL